MAGTHYGADVLDSRTQFPSFRFQHHQLSSGYPQPRDSTSLGLSVGLCQVTMVTTSTL